MTKAKRDKEIERKKKLILRHFTKLQTINEVIHKLFIRDVYAGRAISRGWRYYVHLNKLPSILEKEGRLKCRGCNEDNEKLWLKV